MFIEGVNDKQIQSQLTAQSVAVPQPVSLFSLAFPALLRLSLLLGPLVVATWALHRSPIFCVLACVAVLAVWLTVDAGPFRAVDGWRSEPRAAALPVDRNNKRVDWNNVFGRLLILLVVICSRVNV